MDRAATVAIELAAVAREQALSGRSKPRVFALRGVLLCPRLLPQLLFSGWVLCTPKPDRKKARQGAGLAHSSTPGDYWLIFLRTIPEIPSNAVPNSVSVAGSGVDVVEYVMLA